MSDLTVLPVTVEHHREPIGIGETDAAAVLGDRAPTCPTGGRPPTSWRSSRRTARPGRPAASTPPSRCSCRGVRRRSTSRERRTVRVRVWGGGRRRAVGVERGRRRRGRAARAGGLDGELVQPLLPEPGGRGAGRRCCAASSCSTSRSSGPGCTPPRTGCTRPRSNGATVGDHVLAPGLDQLPATGCATRPTTSPTCSPRARNAIGVHAGRRLVPRPPRVHRRAAALRRPDRRLRPAGGRARRRQPHGRDHRRLLALDARAGDPGRHLQGRDRRLPPRAARLVARRASTTPTGRRSRSGRCDVATLVAPTGPPVRRTQTLPVQEISHLAVGQDAGRLRPEPGRPAPVLACPTAPAGTEITVRHAEVLEHGELGHPAAAQGRRRPTSIVLDGQRAADLGAAVHLPRLPLRRGRPAGPAS